MDVDIYIEDRKWKLIGKLEREEGKRCFAYSRGLIKTDGVRARAMCVCVVQRFRAVKLQVQSCNTRARRRRWRYPRSNTWFPHLANWSLAPFSPPPLPSFYGVTPTDSSRPDLLSHSVHAPLISRLADRPRQTKNVALYILSVSLPPSLLSYPILVLNCARANARTTSGLSVERTVKLGYLSRSFFLCFPFPMFRDAPSRRETRCF